jgi:putative membrane-bound dehydrogenase-like protein
MRAAVFFVFATIGACACAFGDETVIGDHKFALPAGFTIELVAGQPLVDRPITAAFDEQGRLYVADSSGSNDPVQKQLEEKTHRIVRLVDKDNDGKFDEQVVFADKMMFPEGTLWHDGSLYVAAPPSIWKLTDTDGDGIADKREEWMQGKTLTGCANDLHGPYLGPDGYIYWCKGAFAEQTYERPGSAPFVSRAAHIFRCKPNAPRDPQTGAVLSSAIEPVMTGGMDNPVDVVFTPGGERIFTTTFLVHPGNGERDGLIHAVYGGVWGKQHGVLDGHIRTGDLMPVLVHLGPAAPAGLVRYESEEFGPKFRDNLFACCFNMHKLTRHVLTEKGATFAATTEDFLTSSNIDFHPTDVIEDSDGSLLVVDTGGWYKLCCPTSQLAKPDVLGGIYRIKRISAGHDEARATKNSRGELFDWSNLPQQQLLNQLSSSLPMIRERAICELAKQRDAGATDLAAFLKRSYDPLARRNAVWALTRIDAPAARKAVRDAIRDSDSTVRRVALYSVGLWRDKEALSKLPIYLKTTFPHEARLAVEAVGRIGEDSHAPYLLSLAAQTKDRVLQHSIIHALIEIGSMRAIERGLLTPNDRAIAAAAIAGDQIDRSVLTPEKVIPWLSSAKPELRTAANWLLPRHSEWGEALVAYFREFVTNPPTGPADVASGKQLLGQFARQEEIRRMLAEVAIASDLDDGPRALALETMRDVALNELPVNWVDSLTLILLSEHRRLAPLAVAVARSKTAPKESAVALRGALRLIAQTDKWDEDTRISALAAFPAPAGALDDPLFNLLASQFATETSLERRAATLKALAKFELSTSQLADLTGAFAQIGPLDTLSLLALYQGQTDVALGEQLVKSLRSAPALASLRADAVTKALEKFPDPVRLSAGPIYEVLNVDPEKQRGELETLLGKLTGGDVRRGLAVFHSPKAACSACHQLGYKGGNIGPDLSKIGAIRSDRDLLEAIAFPNASFVRSYEPVVVTTSAGVTHSGVRRDENDGELTIFKSATEKVRLKSQDVETVAPGQVSIMPSGLAQQLSVQEIADLVAFLKSAK